MKLQSEAEAEKIQSYYVEEKGFNTIKAASEEIKVENWI